MKIEDIKTAITHSGTFHMDDVASTAFLLRLNSQLKIQRVAKFLGEGEEDTIVYDIGMGRFDHHQQDRKTDENGVAYSAFGLLFEEFGEEFLALHGIKDTVYGKREFKNIYLSKINYGDNYGYDDVENFGENDLVRSFNPSWYELEEGGNGAYDECFKKAVKFCDSLFDIWLKKIKQVVEYSKIEEEIWQKALQESANGVIFVPSRIPTKKRLEENHQLKFIIKTDIRSGGYAIYSSDEEKYKLRPNENFTFVHPSGFMAICLDLEVAKRTLAEMNY